MASIGTLVVNLTISDAQFEKALKRSRTKMRRFAKQTQKIGRNLERVGRNLTTNVSLPIAGIGIAAAKMATDFDDSMSKIQGLVGESAEEVKRLKGEVLKLAGPTAKSPRELAEGLFFIESAGLRGAAAIDTLRISARASAAGLGETKVVADALTNATNAYGIANLSAARAGDILTATVREGKAEASALAAQFGRILPVAAELKVKFEEVGGGLAFLTRSSGNASLAATQLAAILNKLIKPSEQGKKALDDVGLSFEKVRQSIKEKGLLKTLVEVREALGNDSEALGKVFEDSQALVGVLALTTEGGMRAKEVFDNTANSVGVLDEAFDAASQTAKFKFTKALAQLEAAGIKAGAILIPPLIKLANIVVVLAERFAALEPKAQKNIIIIAGLAAVVGPAILVLGQFVAAIGTVAGAFQSMAAGVAVASFAAFGTPLTAPVLGAILLFASFAAALIVWRDDISKIFRVGVDGWIQIFDDAWKTIGRIWDNSTTKLVVGIGTIIVAIKGLAVVTKVSFAFFATAITGPIALAIVALAGFLTVLFLWSDEISKAFFDGAEAWTQISIDAWKTIGRIWNVGLFKVAEGVEGWRLVIRAVFQSLAGFIPAKAKEIFLAMKKWLLDKLTSVVDGIGKQLQRIKGFFGDVKNLTIPPAPPKFGRSQPKQKKTNSGNQKSPLPTGKEADFSPSTFKGLGKIPKIQMNESLKGEKAGGLKATGKLTKAEQEADEYKKKVQEIIDTLDRERAELRLTDSALELNAAIRKLGGKALDGDKKRLEEAIKLRNEEQAAIKFEKVIAGLREKNKLAEISLANQKEINRVQFEGGDLAAKIREDADEQRILNAVRESGLDPLSEEAKEVREVTSELLSLEKVREELATKFKTSQASAADFQRQFNSAVQESLTPLDIFNQRITELDEGLKNNLIVFEQWDVLTKKAKQTLDDASKSAAQTGSRWVEMFEGIDSLANRAGQSFTNLLSDIATSGEITAQAFKDVASSIIQDLIRIIIQKKITDAILGGLNIGSGATAPISLAPPNIPLDIAGARAGGGSVTSGDSFLVGERGAELFVPNVAGSIIPNSELGGTSQTIVVEQNNNFAVGIRGEVRAELDRQLPKIEKAAIRGVQEASLRGGGSSRAIRGR
ncbi:MAG: phage tail tape measure protein [Phycisphaeraceae bacterium]|nr:phage tail tape measure protein [Phycisphaeraceae bacterium]